MAKRKRVERSKKKKTRKTDKGESFEQIHTQTYTGRKKKKLPIF